MRRTELEQIGVADDDLDTVLGEYGRHRLLTFDRDPVSRTPTVELAHEALISQWERYKGWVDEARQDLLTRRHVESAARDWLDAGSENSFLYGGGRLELAESWATSSGFELTDDEHRFLAASRDKVDRDRSVRRKRRRVIGGVLVAATVAATAMAGVAVVQRRNADEQRRTPRTDRPDPGEGVGGPHATGDRGGPGAGDAAGVGRRRSDRRAAPRGRLRGPPGDPGDADRRRHQWRGGVLIRPEYGRLNGRRRPPSTRPGYVLIDAGDGAVIEEVSTDHQPGPGALSFAPSGEAMAVAYQGPWDEAKDRFLDHDGDPAIERFEIPGGRLIESLAGPPGAYQNLFHDSSGRWLGAIHVDPSGHGKSSSGTSRPAGRRDRSAPRPHFRFLPGTESALVLGPDRAGV